MYDIAIIGAGPAGMTAGIYAARKKLKTLILAKQAGGQLVEASEVENYTGFSLISGADLALKFREHLLSLSEDLEFKEGVVVANLEKNITSFAIHDTTGTVYYSKAVIVCSGREPKFLGVPGEKKFFGRGVSICTACDAPLYKDLDVAVVGGGNSAVQALLALSKLARTVYSIYENKTLQGDEILIDKISGRPNIKFYPQGKVLEITGDSRVRGVAVAAGGAGREILPVSGVFVEIGWEPNVAFETLSRKNRLNEIIVDNNLQTNIAGLFAAGDVNDAWGEQVVIAAGEGAKAALAAADFLAKLR